MSKIVNSSAGVATALAVLLSAGAAQALSNHTWVSHTGSDSNPCTAALPCGSLGAAAGKTAAGGQIDIMDAGEYGSVAMFQGISIVNDSAGVASVQGIGVNASTGDFIFRGLTFNGIDGASYGVEGFSFHSLLIDHCHFYQYGNGTHGGVYVWPNVATKLVVVDSLLSSDGANGYGSIHIAPQAGGSMSAQIERVQILDAISNGVRVDGTNGAAQVELRDVTVHGAEGGSGIVALSSTSGGPPAVIYADNVAASGNAGYGLRAVGGTAAIYLNRSTITDNGIGIGASSGGAVVSFSNNSFAGNGTDGSLTSTIAQK